MMKLKDLNNADKPREKLLKYCPEKLTDYELMSILLHTGTKSIDVKKLSQIILRKYKEELPNVSVKDLMSINGLGLAKACDIVACFELGRRFLGGKKITVMLSPRDVWRRMEDIRSSKKEHFVVFYLNSRDHEIAREIISIGTLNESLVHPREVFEEAIKNNASSIIVAHNHPSGDINPSSSDIEITKRLVNSGKILGIRVNDSIVVSKTSYKSIIQVD